MRQEHYHHAAYISSGRNICGCCRTRLRRERGIFSAFYRSSAVCCFRALCCQLLCFYSYGYVGRNYHADHSHRGGNIYDLRFFSSALCRYGHWRCSAVFAESSAEIEADSSASVCLSYLWILLPLTTRLLSLWQIR